MKSFFTSMLHTFFATGEQRKKSNQQSEYTPPESIAEAFENPRYQGKIVIESPEGLYSTTKEENAIKKLHILHGKYESEQIVTTVIPKGLMGVESAGDTSEPDNKR